MSRSAPTLLILSQVYVPDPASVGQHMHDAAVEMVKRGWRVIVLTSARGYEDPGRRYPRRESLDGVDIRRFPLSSFGKRSIAVRLLGGGLFLLQAIGWALFARDVRCVLVSTSPPIAPLAGVLLCRLRGLPVKYWAMDINPDQMVRLGRIGAASLPAKVFDWMNRAMLRCATAVVVPDRFMAENLNRKAPVSRRTTIIPPWPHIDRTDEILPHERNPFRQRHGLTGRFVFMYSGNLSLSHPVTTVLEASLRLADLEQLIFLFIGGGLGRAEVAAFLARNPKAPIRLLPYQPLAELPFSLSAADVHLVTVGDAMVGVVHSCKVYGAMAVGRPVLLLGPKPCHVTDILDADEIGWRAAHGDVAGLERQIRAIVQTDPRELADRGRRAQRLVSERYSRHLLCTRFGDLIERT